MDNEKTPLKKTPFIQVPKVLFENERYKHLSIASILLYAFLLDRYRLAIRKTRTKKFDQAQIYISFSIAEAKQLLRCGHDKTCFLFRELQTVGLIDRKRKGLGQYSQITVYFPFASYKESENLNAEFQDSQIADNRVCRGEEIEETIYKEIDTNNINKTNANMESNDSLDDSYDFEMLFESLYEHYPANRKGSRVEAYDAYRKSITTYDDAIMALENLTKWCNSTNWKNEGGKYIPLFRNYLLRSYWQQPPPISSSISWGSGTQGEAEREAIRKLMEG